MFIRQIDRNSLQIQGSKDGQKQDIATGKIQTAAQNVQMITVPPGMTVLQNPLSIGQMPTVLGQPNSHVYMIPTNQSNIVQTSGLPPGLIGQQMLQHGQNVTVMQPNQLAVPNSVQYNTLPLMPMNMGQNTQYVPTGINLNNPLAAQQLNAALANQQLTNSNLTVSGTTIPILQTNPSAGSPMTNIPQTISVSQSTPLHQMMQQNATYASPGQQLQNTAMTQQYVMQSNSTPMSIQANAPGLQYSLQSNQSNSQQSNIANNSNNQSSASAESESASNSSNSNASNQSGFISSSSQQTGYPIAGAAQTVQNSAQQTYTPDNNNQNTSGFTPANQSNNSQQNYTTANNAPNVQNPSYNQSSANQSSGTYNTTNASNPPPGSQNTYATSAPNSQNVQQSNFSPSTTPAPQNNQTGTYAPNNLVNLPNTSVPQTFAQSQQGNPYPNATGQNMAAYANNQYQYNNRPWFRAPRFGSPQGPMYNTSNVPPPNGPPLPVPTPAANYNYWQDS